MPTRGNYQATGLGLFGDNIKDAMWLDAPHPLLIPPTWGFGQIIDFNDGTLAADQWTTTVISDGAGTSTVAVINKEGGWVRIDTAADELDGGQAQADFANIRLASTNKFWIDFRIDLTEEVTQCNAFCGLSITNATIIPDERVDWAVWVTDDGDANWDFATAKSSTETDVAAADTAVLDVPIVLGFKWDGVTLTPYSDGVAATAITTNIPDDVDLKLSFGYSNGDGTAANEGMNVDWIRYVSVFDRS